MTKEERKRIYEKILNDVQGYINSHHDRYICFQLLNILKLESGDVDNPKLYSSFPEFRLFKRDKERGVWSFHNNKERAICLEFCIQMCN